MEDKTIALDYPLNLDGRQVAELTMRRPKVKDQRNADKAASDNAGKELQLFASLTGMNPEDLEEMDLSDYTKLQNAYSGFLS